MFNLDDPKTLALLMAGARLLQHDPRQKANFGNDLSRGLLGGLQGYQMGKSALSDAEERKQREEMRRMQMDQMKRQRENEGKLGQAFQSAFGPNPNLVTNDDMGNPMPQVPGGGGMPELIKSVGAFDPRTALSMMPKPKEPTVHALSEGQELYDSTGKKLASGAPKRDGPQRGTVRTVYRGSSAIQQEWDGAKWSDIGSGPRFAPQQPSQPNMQSVTVGDKVYTFNPKTGQYAPATATDGSQIVKPPGPDKKLTEGEGKATLYVGMMQNAEDAIGKLNFDPATLKNQTLIALARGDVPNLPKVMQNSMAGKEAQQYAQGTFQWTEAMLRQLTGAAAPDTEVWRQAKTYWPQPGDSKEVIAQKNAARKQVAEYVRIVAGPGAAKADAATIAQPQAPSVEDLIKKYAR